MVVAVATRLSSTPASAHGPAGGAGAGPAAVMTRPAPRKAAGTVGTETAGAGSGAHDSGGTRRTPPAPAATAQSPPPAVATNAPAPSRTRNGPGEEIRTPAALISTATL